MNIVVAGATRGIGREIVLNLAEDEANSLLAIGRSQSALDLLSVKRRNVRTLVLDISEAETRAEEISDYAGKHFGKIDILINAAGLLVNRMFADITSFEARKMAETNFLGPAALIRILMPFMPSGSHIVNIASMGGFQGSSKYPGLSYYSATKAALACLTECLAGEFRDMGISVNCLALGAVQTEMFEQAFPGYKAPVDAASMAKFICGFALEGNRYFNGKILPVALSNP